MSGKKTLSFEERWKKITSKPEYESSEIAPTVLGTTTSISQMQKASQAPAGKQNQILNQVSKEQESLNNFKLARTLALEEKKAKEESILKVEPGTLDDKIKQGMNNDQAFLTFKAKEEEREQLADKGLWNRFKTSFARQGIIPSTVGGPASALANLLFSDEEIAQSFTKPGLSDKGRTNKEEKKFNELNKEYETIIKPYTKAQQEASLELSKQHKQNINKITKEIGELSGPDTGMISAGAGGMGLTGVSLESLDKISFSDFFSGLFSSEDKKPTSENIQFQENQEKVRQLNKDKAAYYLALTKTNQTIEKLDDFNKGKSNAWSGLNNNWRDIATIGVHGILSDIKLYEITQKKEKDRTEAEKAALMAYGEQVELDKKDLFKDRFWYRAGEGAGASVVFMESTLLTGGFGGAVQGATKQALKSGLKKVISSSLKNSFKRKLGVALTQKVLPSVAGTMAQAAVSPTTYAAMLKQKIGDVRVIEDENGNKKVVTSDVSYNKFMEDYNSNKKALDYFISELEKKENLSQEDQLKLQEYQENLRDLNSEFEVLRPKSWAESFTYGYTETLKEFFSEKYVGKLGNKATKALTQSKFGKYVASKNPLQKTFKAAKEFTDWGQNYVNNTTVGKISSKALYHTGANKVYDGLPGEIIEEIAVQAMPTFRTENFIEEYKNQLRELKEPTFYADIAGQTLVMSGGTTTLGAVGSAVNYRKRKKF